MYIGRIMHTDLVTVQPNTSLVEAANLIEKKKIDHLLVVDKNKKLVGIISDKELKQYWASPATSLSTHELNYLLEKVEISTAMVKTVITVPTSTTIERAALIMEQNRISSLPVMEGEDLVGIITSTDVMHVLLKAIGISDDSVRLGIFVKDAIGMLEKVCETLKESGINIQSIISWPEENYDNVTQLVLRIAAADEQKAMDALQAEGFKVKNKYVKDITPYLPQ